MKNYSFSEITIAWHKYLMDNVIHESYFIEFTKAKFPYIIHLKNIIESGINISTRWGIITLEFKTYSQKQEFSSFIKSNYNEDKFPCRIYFESSNKTISFYNSKDKTFINQSDELDYFIKILNNVLIDINNFKKILN
jgi:hypothetical protein